MVPSEPAYSPGALHPELFVGRQAELDQLSDAMQEPHCAVTVVGEAGIGKTSLVRQALYGTEDRTAVYFGGALATLPWVPYLPLQQAFRGPGMTPPPRGFWAGDAEFVADAVEPLVGTGVLVLDDVQWADAATWSVLALLVSRVRTVTIVRRGDAAADQALRRLAELGSRPLEVGPLGRAESIALARQSARERDAIDIESIVDRAGGNPLLVTELAAGNVSSLKRAMAARVAALPLHAADDLEMLALAGRSLPLALVAGGPTLQRAGVAVIADGEVVMRHSLLADVVIEAMADHRRNAVHRRLAQVLPDAGSRAHHYHEAGDDLRAYAQAMIAAEAAGTPGEQAEHLTLAASCASPSQGAVLMLRAARAAVQAGDYVAAGSCLDRIDELRPIEAEQDARPVISPADRAEIAVLRARVLSETGDRQGWRAFVETAVQSVRAGAGRSGDGTEGHSGDGTEGQSGDGADGHSRDGAEGLSGDDSGRPDGQPAPPGVGDGGDEAGFDGDDARRATVSLLAERARATLQAAGDVPTAVAQARTALAFARRPHAYAEYVLGTALYYAGEPEWRDHLAAALEQARREGDLQVEMRAANNVISGHEGAGDPRLGREIAREMAQRAQALQLLRWRRHFWAAELNLAMHAGDYADVAASAPTLLAGQLMRRTRDEVTSCYAMSLVNLGRAAEGVAVAEATLADSELCRSNLLHVRAVAAAYRGDQHAVLAEWPAFLAAAENPHRLALAAPVFAYAARSVGAAPLDLPDLAAGYELPAVHAVPHELAAIAAGDPLAAAGGFAEAARLWAPYHRHGEVRCRWLQGEALIAAGEITSATTALRETEELARRHHMAPMLTLVERTLRSVGVRRSGPRTGGLLSARQAQILGLVRRGLTDAAIAGEIGLSVRTVQTHIASAREKLGAATRQQAALVAEGLSANPAADRSTGAAGESP